jgi:adenylate kinase
VKSLIFVGGIHGVGKTSWCKERSAHAGIAHYSASTLIAQERNDSFTSDKRVDQVEENQLLLLSAVRRTRASQRFLLDGHFCLVNKENAVERVPYQTFADLNPSGIILLKDNVCSIYERLGARDAQHYDLSFLEKFQNAEMEYAQYVSEKLRCPVNIITPTDMFDLSGFVSECYKEGTR